jgi:protein ImuB
MDRKVLCIFLPMLSVELCLNKLKKRDANKVVSEALLLVSRYRQEEIVMRRSIAAKKHKVHIGMPLSHALSLAPNAEVLPFDYQYEQKALRRIARWAYRFSPITAVDPGLPTSFPEPQHCGTALDITGCERLFGGDKRLTLNIRDSLKHYGVSTRIAVAPTFGAAWALSRYHRSSLVITDRNSLKTHIAQLPLEALRIQNKTLNSLHSLQLSCIQDVLQLPRSSLLKRFGPDLLTRLDQIQGFAQEVLTPIEFIKPIKEEITFLSPLEQYQALQRSVEKLLLSLVSKIEVQNKKISRLILKVQYVDKLSLFKEAVFSAPSIDKKHLWSMMRHRLEQVDATAGIESLTLTAERTEEVTAYPTSALPGQALSTTPVADYGQLLDTLIEHLGAKSVLYVEPQASHIPERSFCYKSVQGDQSNLAPLPQTSFNQTLERPSILFAEPHPIHALALMPDYPPTWLKWRSKAYKVLNGIGPERIAPEWWGRDNQLCTTRDYFRVQIVSGTWLWVFRDLEQSKWFIHGLWA